MHGALLALTLAPVALRCSCSAEVGQVPASGPSTMAATASALALPVASSRQFRPPSAE
jgi:hypothetical protein